MRSSGFIIGVLLGLMLLSPSCVKETNTSSAQWDQTPYLLEKGSLPDPKLPSDNPLTVQKVRLGRMLFHEKKLSLDNSMSCASCHRQEHAFSDTSRFSVGIHGLAGHRQSMAVFNMAWNDNGYFWDGRAEKLRDQSLMPIQDSLEMAEDLDNVVDKLSALPTYTDQFIRAFGSGQITAERMSLSLEAFMLSIVSVNSRYDAFLRGEEVLSDSEERGRALFFQEYNPFFPDQSGADCAHCHSNLNFENDLYMNNGLDAAAFSADPGRGMVTQDPQDFGKMKVPSLRNVALTAPYMHDGRFETLDEVVEHYNAQVQNSPTLDPALVMTLPAGLLLSPQDKQDLVAFLNTLTDLDLPTEHTYSNPFE